MKIPIGRDYWNKDSLPVYGNQGTKTGEDSALSFAMKREFIHFGMNEIDDLGVTQTPQLLSPQVGG